LTSAYEHIGLAFLTARRIPAPPVFLQFRQAPVFLQKSADTADKYIEKWAMSRRFPPSRKPDRVRARCGCGIAEVEGIGFGKRIP